MKLKKKQFILTLRLAIGLLFLFSLYWLKEEKVVAAPLIVGEAPLIYASACQDPLDELYLKAIEEAKHSILLIIYSLNHSKIIQALNQKAASGLSVQVLHDGSTPYYGFKKLSKKIDKKVIKMSGLMHQKLLVVDGEKVLIGSSNLTKESLRLHDNLVIGLIQPELAEAIIAQNPELACCCGGQPLEFWAFPKRGKEGLARLLQLIDSAQKTMCVAMFTWTHPLLTDAVISAHERGVEVEVILDQGQAQGVCRIVAQRLIASGIPVHFNRGPGLLHHKFVWIDETILINGSANWTKAAFTRNKDCFLILFALNAIQNEKLKKLWRQTQKLSAEETILRLAA